MSAIRIRKVLTALVLVLGLFTVSFYTIGPAAADDNPPVVLGPAPTNPPVAAPTVKKAHRHGYIKACEPTRAHHGRKIYLAYGSFKRPEPDGYTVLRPGHCKVFRVHHVYGAKHRIDWAASRFNNGAPVAAGHVWHIKL